MCTRKYYATQRWKWGCQFFLRKRPYLDYFRLRPRKK